MRKVPIKRVNVAYKRIDTVEKAVSACLELLKLRIPRKGVLIKPNLVVGAPPGKSVSTNVYVLVALVNWLRGKGIEPIIAEGSGCEPTRDAYRHARYDLLEKMGVQLVDLNEDRFVRARVKGALEWQSIEVARMFMDASYVINVPVAKCHHLAGVSLGIKNLMGVLRPIGSPEHGTKSHIHYEWDYGPDAGTRAAKELFERRLVDLLRARPINLTLIDGSYGLQVYEQSRAVIKTDFLIASQDCIAADVLCAKVMGFRPEEVYHLAKAQEVLGKRAIAVVGDRPGQFKFRRSEVWERVR